MEMDPDSFLNLQSPELEHAEDWCPSPDAQFWDLTVREPQPEFCDSFLENKLNVSYSSVLKLSDIASALKGFSSTEVHGSIAKSKSLFPSNNATRQLHSTCATTGKIKRDLHLNRSIEDRVLFTGPSPAVEVSSCCLKRFSSTKRLKLSLAKSELQISPAQRELQHRNLRRHGLSQREIHIHSERQRRKCMTDSFAILQSLVPKLKYQHTDRVTVLTEVITYIQSLRGTLEELERKKSDILEFLALSDKRLGKQHLRRPTFLSGSDKSSIELWDESASPVEVTSRLSGKDVFVTLSIPKRKGVWSGVLMLLQRYSVEVVNSTMTVCGENNFHCIHGKATYIDKLEGVNLQGKLEDLIFKELRRSGRAR